MNGKILTLMFLKYKNDLKIENAKNREKTEAAKGIQR